MQIVTINTMWTLVTPYKHIFHNPNCTQTILNNPDLVGKKKKKKLQYHQNTLVFAPWCSCPIKLKKLSWSHDKLILWELISWHHSSTISARLSTIAAVVNNFSTVTHTSLCLAYSKVKLWLASENTATLCSTAWSYITPTRNVPEAPELGTPCYKGQNFGTRWCPGSTVVTI